MANINYSEPQEFHCKDCGMLVYSFSQRPFVEGEDKLCAECAWLRGIEDTEERKKLQAFLRNR